RPAPGAGTGWSAPAGTDTPAAPPFPDTAVWRPYRLTPREWHEYTRAAPSPSPAVRPTPAGVIPPSSPAGPRAAPGSGARQTPGAGGQSAASAARDGAGTYPDGKDQRLRHALPRHPSSPGHKLPKRKAAVTPMRR